MIREIRKKLVVLSNRRPFPQSVKDYINHLERVDWIYMNLRLDGSPLTRQEAEQILGGEPVMNGRIMDHVLISRLDDLRNELYDLAARDLDISPELCRLMAEKCSCTNSISASDADSAAAAYRKSTPSLMEYSYTPVLPLEIPQAMKELAHYANRREDFDNPFEKAAGIHNGFLSVFPYRENNQFVARALMEYHLMLHGLPMAFLDMSESDYNRAFEEFCRTGASRPLANQLTVSTLNRLELMIQLTAY